MARCISSCRLSQSCSKASSSALSSRKNLTCRSRTPQLITCQARVAGVQISVDDKILSTVTVDKSTDIRWHDSLVTRDDKEFLLGQRGCVLWFTGLSASGKSTVACELEHLLRERGHYTMLLDGDNIRHGLNSNLGFSPEDRAENIRRIGEVAKLTAESGAITITSFISPYKADRDAVRERMNEGDYLEIYMKVPLSICEERDPKGLYKKAREGKIPNFTGISDPYEEPVNPEIVIEPYGSDGKMQSPRAMAAAIVEHLEAEHYLADPRLRTIAAATSIMGKSFGAMDERNQSAMSAML